MSRSWTKVVHDPSSRCVGAEMLLRWTHPELGDISPAECIPIVEQSSHAKPLTHWVLDRALEQLAAWQERGWDVPLSVNISATNLEEDYFAVRVQLLLLKHRIRPDRRRIGGHGALDRR